MSHGDDVQRELCDPQASRAHIGPRLTCAITSLDPGSCRMETMYNASCVTLKLAGLIPGRVLLVPLSHSLVSLAEQYHLLPICYTP